MNDRRLERARSRARELPLLQRIDENGADGGIRTPNNRNLGPVPLPVGLRRLENGAPPGIRTRNDRGLNPVPLPVGLGKRGGGRENRALRSLPRFGSTGRSGSIPGYTPISTFYIQRTDENASLRQKRRAAISAIAVPAELRSRNRKGKEIPSQKIKRFSAECEPWTGRRKAKTPGACSAPGVSQNACALFRAIDVYTSSPPA